MSNYISWLGQKVVRKKDSRLYPDIVPWLELTVSEENELAIKFDHPKFTNAYIKAAFEVPGAPEFKPGEVAPRPKGQESATGEVLSRKVVDSREREKEQRLAEKKKQEEENPVCERPAVRVKVDKLTDEMKAERKLPTISVSMGRPLSEVMKKETTLVNYDLKHKDGKASLLLEFTGGLSPARLKEILKIAKGE